MYVHNILLADYRSFQTAVRLLLTDLERGEPDRLRERTITAIWRLRLRYSGIPYRGNTGPESTRDRDAIAQWPFAEHGAGDVPEPDHVRQAVAPGGSEIGKWLLLILSEYVYPPEHASVNLGVLVQALGELGWGSSKRENLLTGDPLQTLLRDESSGRARSTSPNYSEYFKPAHARKAGWIGVELAATLHNELVSIGDSIMNFDVRRLPSIADKQDPYLTEEFTDRLIDGYESAVRNLAVAVKSNLGLITSISLSN